MGRSNTPTNSPPNANELAALTAELRVEAESDAAKAAAAAAEQRLLEAGRSPGWSLQLNPTPALLDEAGLPDADSYRFMQQRKERARAREYALKRAGIEQPGSRPQHRTVTG